MQTRHLVFILVSHDAIQALGDCARQTISAAKCLRFAHHHLVQQHAVAASQIAILIGHQSLGTGLDQCVQRLRRLVQRVHQDFLFQCRTLGKDPAP